MIKTDFLFLSQQLLWPTIIAISCDQFSFQNEVVTRVIFERTGSLQTKLNAGLSVEQQEDLFQKINVVSTE